MRVIVRDRFRDTQRWGHGADGPALRSVDISDSCPACGGPRGKPTLQRYVEDSEDYHVHVWVNPCGHVDRYAAVLREAGIYTGAEMITNQWAGPGWTGRLQAEIDL